MNTKEKPADYAQRRANETRRAYLILSWPGSDVVLAWPDTGTNRQGARELGASIAVVRPTKAKVLA